MEDEFLYYLDGEKPTNHHVFLRMVREAKRCCAKTVIDVVAVKFRFGAVILLLDEADEKVSITRSHFSAHSDSVNLFVIVTRERKAVKCENEFRKASKRFGARLFVRALVKKVFEYQESFMVGDNCVQRGYIDSENEFVLPRWRESLVYKPPCVVEHG